MKIGRGWCSPWVSLPHFIFTSHHPNVDLLFCQARVLTHSPSTPGSWGRSITMAWNVLTNAYSHHTNLYGQVRSQILLVFSCPLSPQSLLFSSKLNSLPQQSRLKPYHFFKISYSEALMASAICYICYHSQCCIHTKYSTNTWQSGWLTICKPIISYVVRKPKKRKWILQIFIFQ